MEFYAGSECANRRRPVPQAHAPFSVSNRLIALLNRQSLKSLCCGISSACRFTSSQIGTRPIGYSICRSLKRTNRIPIEPYRIEASHSITECSPTRRARVEAQERCLIHRRLSLHSRLRELHRLAGHETGPLCSHAPEIPECQHFGWKPSLRIDLHNHA
jgi:hypothetical protein